MSSTELFLKEGSSGEGEKTSERIQQRPLHVTLRDFINFYLDKPKVGSGTPIKI